jgi:hypothetical protein
LCSEIRFFAKPQNVTNKAKKKDSDNENDRENGLRMKNEMTMKEKRFSFFAAPQERKAESQPTLHTLASRTSRNTDQNLPKSAISNPQK